MRLPAGGWAPSRFPGAAYQVARPRVHRASRGEVIAAFTVSWLGARDGLLGALIGLVDRPSPRGRRVKGLSARRRHSRTLCLNDISISLLATAPIRFTRPAFWPRAVRRDRCLLRNRLGNDRYRRIFLVAPQSDEGPLTEPTTATQLWGREPLFLPLCTPYPWHGRIPRNALATGSTSYAGSATMGANNIGTLKLLCSSPESPTKLDKRWLAKLASPTFRYTADMYRNGSPIG